MNERIEELAGQAFQYAADNADETGKGHLGVFADKFAELIVKETLNVALYGEEFEQARTNVKTLFGVEE